MINVISQQMLRLCMFLKVVCSGLLIKLDSVYYTVHGFTMALNIHILVPTKSNGHAWSRGVTHP